MLVTLSMPRASRAWPPIAVMATGTSRRDSSRLRAVTVISSTVNAAPSAATGAKWPPNPKSVEAAKATPDGSPMDKLLEVLFIISPQKAGVDYGGPPAPGPQYGSPTQGGRIDSGAGPSLMAA